MIAIEHRVKIAQFILQSPAGIALMEELRATKPKPVGDTMEKVALNAKKGEGWEECMSQITDIATERPVNAEEMVAGPSSMSGETETKVE